MKTGGINTQKYLTDSKKKGDTNGDTNDDTDIGENIDIELGLNV